MDDIGEEEFVDDEGDPEDDSGREMSAHEDEEFRRLKIRVEGSVFNHGKRAVGGREDVAVFYETNDRREEEKEEETGEDGYLDEFPER